jgi:hypothetical protein
MLQQDQLPAPNNMSTTTPDRKVKRLKLAGSVYFIVLGLINIIATAYYAHLSWKDLLLLAMLCTPLLVNKKIYYLLFGGLATVFWIFMLYTVFQTHTLYVREVNDYTNPHFTPAQAFSLGYLATAVSACFSFMLLWVGTRSTPEQDIDQDATGE